MATIQDDQSAALGSEIQTGLRPMPGDTRSPYNPDVALDEIVDLLRSRGAESARVPADRRRVLESRLADLLAELNVRPVTSREHPAGVEVRGRLRRRTRRLN